jgi:hypothetical protein
MAWHILPYIEQDNLYRGITLAPGKETRPTDTSTAIRVRAVGPDRRFGVSTAREIVLPLEVLPEPSLRVQRVTSVHIDRATDDNKQKLTQSTPAPGPAGPAVAPIGVIARFGPNAWPPITSVALRHYKAVRLAAGARPSKVLTELTGTIGAEVLDEAEAILTADNLDRAAGKTFTSKYGGALKVISVDKDKDGKLTLRYSLEFPKGIVPEQSANSPRPPATPAPPGPAAGGFGRVPRAPVANTSTTQGVSLRDDKDRTLPVQTNVDFAKLRAGTMEWTMEYTPQKGHGTPSKLVFTGRRSVTINIPFTLKDIKLP